MTTQTDHYPIIRRVRFTHHDGLVQKPGHEIRSDAASNPFPFRGRGAVSFEICLANLRNEGDLCEPDQHRAVVGLMGVPEA